MGTVLSKTFGFWEQAPDGTKRLRLIETRLLVHEERGWIPLPYRWNSAQTDADLVRIGATIDVVATTESGVQQPVRYKIPNVNQCNECHVRIEDYSRTFIPIGLQARYLNRDVVTETGSERNQLEMFADAGLFAQPLPPHGDIPVAVPADDQNFSAEQRAKAYLDINCSHCHSPHGSANTSGLFLHPEFTDPFRWGVCKTSVASGSSRGTYKYDVEPGAPEQSLLYLRLISLDPGMMMPELGRSLVHQGGADLVYQWIKELPGHCP